MPNVKLQVIHHQLIDGIGVSAGRSDHSEEDKTNTPVRGGCGVGWGMGSGYLLLVSMVQTCPWNSPDFSVWLYIKQVNECHSFIHL